MRSPSPPSSDVNAQFLGSFVELRSGAILKGATLPATPLT
jgi:hypothetical protein